MTTYVGSFKCYQLSEGRTTPVSARVSPTDRIRGEIDGLFDGSRDLSEIIEDIARLIIQTGWRPRSTCFWAGPATSEQQTARTPGRVARNGYGEATIKTTAG